MSVSLSADGWAWLVHGRRLVVWRYKMSTGQRSLNVACRELTLPASDVAHHARLVNVFAWHENHTPSCLAVSPEGKGCFLFVTELHLILRTEGQIVPQF